MLFRPVLRIKLCNWLMFGFGNIRHIAQLCANASLHHTRAASVKHATRALATGTQITG